MSASRAPTTTAGERRHGRDTRRPAGRGPRATADQFGGLTDAAFRVVPLLESGTDGDWPWKPPTVAG